MRAFQDGVAGTGGPCGFTGSLAGSLQGPSTTATMSGIARIVIFLEPDLFRRFGPPRLWS